MHYPHAIKMLLAARVHTSKAYVSRCKTWRI